MLTDYTKNIWIYCNNLSVYYVICAIISISAIVFTWIITSYNINKYIDENKTEDQNIEETPQAVAEDILIKYKKNRIYKIENISYSLTEEQLKDERRVEQEQLSAILQLLKEQEDKFQVGTMEELEGQLKLYR